MPDIQNLYAQFLNAFPVGVQPIVPLVLAGFLIFSMFQVIKRNFIYLILLVVLLPGSVPILKGVWETAVSLVKLVLGNR